MTEREVLIISGLGLLVAGLAAAGAATMRRGRSGSDRSTPPPSPPSPPPPSASATQTPVSPLLAPSSPPLAPALAALRAEVDAAWPARSRVSDGGAPSAAHHAANPNSDHERGDAYDFTADHVRGPDPSALAELARRDPRVSYVIWDRRIASKSSGNDWGPYERTAVQSDPHVTHVHVSVRDDARADARPWGAAALAGQERIA